MAAKSHGEILEAAEADGLISREVRMRDISRSAGRALQPLTPAALEQVRSAWSAANLLGVSQLATAEMLERLGEAPRNAELAEAIAAGLPQDVLEEALRQPGGIQKTAAALRAAAVSTPSPRPGMFETGHLDGALSEALDAVRVRVLCKRDLALLHERHPAVERHLLAVHDLLEAGSVPHRFLKGAAVAHRFHAHAGLRTFVDVDVLVPDAHLDDAVDRLLGAGHLRLQPDPAPAFTRRFAKSVTVRDRDGVEVDVHRVIADGPFGLRSGSQPLWARPAASLALGGSVVPVLDPVAAFVQACANAVASYDRVGLAALRDVAQIGAAVAGAADEVDHLATALALRPCVADAVQRARRELGWLPPASIEAVAAWSVSDLERRWLDSYRRRPSDRSRALLGLRAVPGIVDRARYALGIAALLAGRPRRRRARGR